MLRRLNEEWGTAVLLAEHRLEGCLAAADRVIALDRGRLACDAGPAGFLAWAASSEPKLATPGARLFSLAGLAPLPPSVKAARSALRGAGLLPDPPSPQSARDGRRPRRSRDTALRVRNLWHELPDGASILAGIDLQLEPGERVALMGRNGAGKSTLLKHLRGLMKPTRGRIDCAGEV